MNISSGTRKKRFFVRVLLGGCILLFLVISAAGYFLKRGVSADELTVGGVVVSDCRLIWKKKLDLQIAEISVCKTEKSQQSTSGANFIGKGIEAGYYLAKFFSRISIGKIIVGENLFSVHLNQENTKPHILILESEDIVFQSRLTFNKDTLDVDIIEAGSSRFNSDLKGKIQLSGTDGKATGNLSALINGSFPVSLDFIADKQQLSFQGSEAGKITEITTLVDLFGLSHNIQRWITDYLSGSRYHLKSFKGILPWSNPKEILTTLEAEVRVEDTEYTFAPGLQPIKALYTDVYFQNGVLIIKPHDATFYGQSGGESWLDINFNDPKNILLTAYIKTRAVANDDILTLLNYYKIRLPFKQVEGKTATDLRLGIVLNKKKIEAQGTFEIDEGVIAWGAKNYKVENARIKLLNSDITIEHLKISYADMFTAQVSGTVQAKKKTGDLDITLEQLTLKLRKSLLSVDGSSPARAHYHFAPDGHILEAQPSSWVLDSLKLTLGAFRAPVFLNDLAIKMPPVHLGAPPGILSEVSGYFSIKKKQADFTCDLLKYHVKDLVLMSPHIVIDIGYDQGLIFRTKETANWELSKMVVMLYPSKFKYHDDVFTVATSRIRYGSFFDSYLAGYFNMNEKKGKFSLNKIEIADQSLTKRLELGENMDGEVNSAGGQYVIYFPAFGLKISTGKEKSWSAEFGDLSAIYSRSKILQKFKIKEGSIVVSSANGKKPYEYTADIKSPYPLLVEDGSPSDSLHITGRHTDEGVSATVNQDLDLNYSDKSLNIRSKNLGYNISALIELAKDFHQASLPVDERPSGGKSFSLKLKADQSQIYLSPKSRILADTMNLEFKNGKLLMDLIHGPGKIQAQVEQGEFMVDGSDLNDEFMGALIQDSSFEGGRMAVGSKGSFDDFAAIFTIEDTVLGEQATLNNVMAFLNTVPALMTFSLPEYNTRGLPIASAVVGMKFKDKVATIESLAIHSSKLEGGGIGFIDFSKKQIDMDINIKTQAAKNVGKIPLAGYVLAGEDSDASVTLKIEGGFDDPQVSHSMGKNIIVYPAEILYRTLKLPFHLGRKIGKPSDEKSGPPATTQDEKQQENKDSGE